MRGITTLVLAGALIGLTGADASAGSRSERRAENYLSDALRAAENDNRHCRRAVIRDLRDIIDEIGRGRLTIRRLERIERDVRELERAAKRDCSRGVRRNLDDSQRHLRDAIEDATADERERRRDRARRDERARRPRIDCWNRSDKACFATRDGQYPMQRMAFASLLKTLNKTTFDSEKAKLVRSAARINYFTTAQLLAITRTTTFDSSKEKMVRYAAARVVDPKNAFVLKQATTFSTSGNKMVDSVTRAARGFRR